ncbi:MAG: acyl-ACP--UDP-N-acetylglucosamine O-acyltransferase [Endozoicomonas sp. (ex Botrylloides leachii)]|nr:acyl-ACP--UDP-N-acetylglucosamine O-acyltransferase [Endozoicomonas sp. (ex Botrylloides leachii)]
MNDPHLNSQQTPRIHPTAIIEPRATLADDVQVGPWTLIGSDVEIDSGTVINSHVVVKGPTKIGRNNRIFQFASVGEDCQDKKYAGERTFLEIGENNIIREGCTIHRGTLQDRGLTYIGNNNLFMAYVHIAHDCVIGNDCILANNSTLGGHVTLGDGVILGGFTGIHQFSTVGAYSMTAGHSTVFKDIPAFVMVSGNPAAAHGMNFEGMRRRGYSQALITCLKQAYRIIYRQGLRTVEALDKLETMESTPELQLLIDSVKNSTRGITR